jgi:uncharacterized membrane protein YkgB
MSRVKDRVLHFENVVHHRLVAHSVTVLRISVGAVFLCFGALKFFPGVSPAESLTKATTHLLTLGLVPGGVSMVAIATLESVIGICLLASRWMRLAVWLLAIQFVGILSPLVLLPGRLFAGPYHAPTLEGQYVLKDVILVGAGMVIAAATFRGGRLVRGDPPPVSRRPPDAALDACCSRAPPIRDASPTSPSDTASPRGRCTTGERSRSPVRSARSPSTAAHELAPPAETAQTVSARTRASSRSASSCDAAPRQRAVKPRISCAVSSGTSSCGQWPTPSSSTQSACGSQSRR